MKKTAAIVDYRISAACESALTERGFFVIKLPPFCKIGSPLSSHTDMLAAHIGDALIMPGDYLNENPADRKSVV